MIKKGGTAIWKSQIWILLATIALWLTISGINFIIGKIFRPKHSNYQELWQDVAKLKAEVKILREKKHEGIFNAIR